MSSSMLSPDSRQSLRRTARGASRGRTDFGSPSEDAAASGRGGDFFVGIVFGVLASSNLVQGAWIERVPWLNITDVSFILAPLIALTGLRRRLSLHGVVALLLLLASLSLGFLEPAASGAGQEKRVNLILGVAFVAVAGFLALSTPRRVKAFFGTLVVLALVAVTAQWLNPDPSALITGRRTPEGLNAIGAARLMGAAATVSVAWGLCGSRRRVGVALLVSIPLAVGLTAAASRGPLLGTCVALFLVLLLQTSFRTRTKALLLCVSAPLAYAVYTRLVVSGSRLTDFSSTGRRVLYEGGLQASLDHPLGVGWGNFFRFVPPTLLNTGQGENLYVHNIILEFLVESGVAGALLFVIFMICVARKALASAEALPGLILTALAANLFVGALLSSDIVGNRMLWVVCSAILALPLLRTTTGGGFSASSRSVSAPGWSHPASLQRRPGQSRSLARRSRG